MQISKCEWKRLCEYATPHPVFVKIKSMFRAVYLGSLNINTIKKIIMLL